MNIAILGATGHVSKCAFLQLSQDKTNVFYLFSQSSSKLRQLCAQFPETTVHCFENYSQFGNFEYDFIFNGIGVWDTPGKEVSSIFPITEYYDNLIIDYQKKHTSSISVHISSGAAYANEFISPVTADTKMMLNINDLKIGDYYSIAKSNSEAKHRSLNNLNIVDIRLFGFFSRYMSLEYSYFISALINSVKNKKVFTYIQPEFWRDYIHMEDFKSLLFGIARVGKINKAIDVRSKSPISKSELIQLFIKRYGLKAEIDNNIHISQTGIKPYYYSSVENSIYSPRFTSFESVNAELEYFLGGESL